MSSGGAFAALMVLVINLSDRAMSQISGNRQRISCTEENMVRTCYDIYNQSSTWSAAWQQCLASDSQLALLETSEVDDLVGLFLEQITQNYDNDFPVWIGGSELSDATWKWISGENFLPQNTSRMTTIFSAQANRYENCAAIGNNQSTTTLVFQSSQCKNAKSFICQQNYTVSTQTSTCEIGSNAGVVIGDQCYAVIALPTPEPLSWFNARLECSKMNATLAVFNESSPQEQEAILSILPNSTQFFWVGLRKQPWVWTTRFDSDKNLVAEWKEMLYTGWLTDIPYQRARSCLAMEGRSGVSHGWINARCDEVFPFICQQTTILTTTPPPTTAGTTTNLLNATEVTNATVTTTTTPEEWEKNLERNLDVPSQSTGDSVLPPVPAHSRYICNRGRLVSRHSEHLGSLRHCCNRPYCNRIQHLLLLLQEKGWICTATLTVSKVSEGTTSQPQNNDEICVYANGVAN